MKKQILKTVFFTNLFGKHLLCNWDSHFHEARQRHKNQAVLMAAHRRRGHPYALAIHWTSTGFQETHGHPIGNQLNPITITNQQTSFRNQ